LSMRSIYPMVWTISATISPGVISCSRFIAERWATWAGKLCSAFHVNQFDAAETLDQISFKSRNVDPDGALSSQHSRPP
jgi:hypothetical protein